MRMPVILKSLAISFLFGLAFFSVEAHAALSSSGVLDTVVQKYQSIAHGWASAITTAATFIFWTLTAISMVWTFGFMALKRADIGEFFAEFLRFTMFTGFFFWLLTNGPTMATAIINGLKQLGTNAGGTALSPSGVVDIGFQIFFNTINQSSVWSPVDSMAGLIISGIVLVVLALVGVNMVILLVTAWFLSYAGIFYLGFGGSKWTSEMAVNYFKTTLGLAMELFAMELLIAAGQAIVSQYQAGMSGTYSLQDLGVMLVAAVCLLALVNKIPPRLAGMVGAGAGHSSGGFGAGAALGAAAMAGAAVATGGAAVAAGAKNIAGGVQALMSAVGKANENMATGSGMFSGSGMGAGGKSGGGSGGAGVSSAMGGNGSDAAPASSSGSSSAGAGASGDAGSTSAADGGASGGDESGASGGGESGASGGDESGASGGGESGASGGGESGASGGGMGVSGGGDSDASGTGTSAGASASGQKPTAGQTARQVANVVGRYSADVAANLAKGSFAVGKEKLQATSASMKAEVSKTVGAQIAAKIAGSGSAGSSTTASAPSAPEFGQNSLSGSNDASVDREAEKAAFVNSKAS